MKNKHHIELIDLRFQFDHISFQKMRLFEDYIGPTNIARKFPIIIRRRQIKKISDGKKLLKLLLFKMTILSFKYFKKKHKLKDASMKESDLQKFYIYPIYPKDSKIYSHKGVVNIDECSMGGNHWTCFYAKDNKSF